MIDLRDDWPEVVRRMQTAKALGILLSVDDTLYRSERGGRRRISEDGLRRIHSLAALDRVSITVHSAEKLSELVAELAIPGLWYVANRGFELRDPQNSEIRFFGPEDVRVLERIQEDLRLQTGHVAGVKLIHRGPCLVLDHQEVDPPEVAVVMDIFRNVLGPFTPQVLAAHVRKTIEVRLRSAFDEKAALRYVHRRLAPGTLLFYFGADPDLLRMFEDFHPFNVLVEVGGEGKSRAKYSLAAGADILDVLEMMETQWKGRGGVPKSP